MIVLQDPVRGVPGTWLYPPLPAVTGQEEGDLERRRGGWGRKRLGLGEEKVGVKGVPKGTWEGLAFVLRDLGVLEHNPREQNGGCQLERCGATCCGLGDPGRSGKSPPTPTRLTHHILPGQVSCEEQGKVSSRPAHAPYLPDQLSCSPAPFPTPLWSSSDQAQWPLAKSLNGPKSQRAPGVGNVPGLIHSGQTGNWGHSCPAASESTASRTCLMAYLPGSAAGVAI